MKQMKYNFSTPVGHAGGLYDLSHYVCDSFNNEAKDGAMKHGMGVVTGSKPGTAVLPSEGSTIVNFEGIVVNGLVTEHNMNGDVVLKCGDTIGIIKQGRIWGLVTEESIPASNKPVYFVIKGEDAGKFATEDDEDNKANSIAINAKFLTEKGTGNIAVIELYPTVVFPTATAPAEDGNTDSDEGTEE